jgi:hypothetical protein
MAALIFSEAHRPERQNRDWLGDEPADASPPEQKPLRLSVGFSFDLGGHEQSLAVRRISGKAHREPDLDEPITDWRFEDTRAPGGD